MITYTHPWLELPNVKLPVLHKVQYGYSSSPASQEWSIKDHSIREWCKTNCRAAYYLHPGYTNEKFVQFEDDQDAVWFALKWAQ